MSDEIEYKIVDNQRKYYTEYYKYLDHLFGKARENGGMQYLYSLLRVSGISDGGWDPFVEAHEALIDFSKILQRVGKKGVTKNSIRLGLLIYCHSIEMAAPYQILYNLLQCIQGKMYIPFPFLGRPKGKKDPFGVIPPSPRAKIEKLKTECERTGEQELINKFNSFFDDDIRNAFYHSDYSITDTEFRICESGLPHSISLKDLSEKLARCFAFYQAFFNIYKQIRFSFKKIKKFHRLPNFEVLEILTDKKEGLIGFRMHFSNGAKAFFERRKERVGGMNVLLEKDHINFFVGDLSKLQRKWILNGRIFREKNTRYNAPCTWRPILFYGNVDEVIKEIKNETNEKDVQGCLFYIKCTGHESIEFAIKSDKELFNGKELVSGKIKVISCDCNKNHTYLYDGTYFLNSQKVQQIKIGLRQISNFVDNYKKQGIKIIYNLKYYLERKIEPIKAEAGRSFTISI